MPLTDFSIAAPSARDEATCAAATASALTFCAGSAADGHVGWRGRAGFGRRCCLGRFDGVSGRRWRAHGRGVGAGVRRRLGRARRAGVGRPRGRQRRHLPVGRIERVAVDRATLDAHGPGIAVDGIGGHRVVGGEFFRQLGECGVGVLEGDPVADAVPGTACRFGDRARVGIAAGLATGTRGPVAGFRASAGVFRLITLSLGAVCQFQPGRLGSRRGDNFRCRLNGGGGVLRADALRIGVTGRQLEQVHRGAGKLDVVVALGRLAVLSGLRLVEPLQVARSLRHVDRVEIFRDAFAHLIVGDVDQPHDQEEGHHRRHEVGMGDLPGRAVMLVLLLLVAAHDDEFVAAVSHPGRPRPPPECAPSRHGCASRWRCRRP